MSLPTITHKNNFLNLLRSGMTEKNALYALKIPYEEYLESMIKNPEFKDEVAQARKSRADVWYGKIADSVDEVIEKDEVPAENLKFNKLKYLASMDNPERFSEKVNHKHSVDINIFEEIKSINLEEANKMINDSDPFTVEAEFEELPDIGDIL